MITHDVDEAIYLADKIFLMTNGPNAVLAEIVENRTSQEPFAAGNPSAPLLLRLAQPSRGVSRQP